MIRESLSFNYAGVSSELMGLTNINIDSGMQSEPFMATRNIEEIEIPGNESPYFQRVKRRAQQFTVSFMFNEKWDDRKLREVRRWLNQSYYQPLWFDDEPERIYYAMVVEDSSIIHNCLKQGYATLTFRCDSPYAYSPVNETRDTTGDVIINNDGDTEIYPEVYIEPAMIAWPNGTIYNEASAGYIQPELTYTYPTSTGNSSPLTTTDLVTHLPSTAEKGRLDISLAGRTLTNFVPNGNFVNTDGWTSEASSSSATGNILTNTANGTAGYGRITLHFPGIKPKLNGKVFVSAKVKVTNANCQTIQLFLRNATSTPLLIILKGLPAQNQVIQIYDVVTATADFNLGLRLYLGHYYVDPAAANGNAAEISEFMAIDLDAHPMFAGMTADQINAAVPMWFDGTKSAFSSVRSVGKNLFDGVFESGSLGTTGVDGVEVTRIRTKNFQKVKPATQYTLSNNSGSVIARLCEYDINKNFVQLISGTTFITSLAAAYIRWAYVSNTDLATKAQLEPGSTATSYAPYLETSYAPATELRSLPNLVKDTLTGDGVLTRRVHEQAITLSGYTKIVTNDAGRDVWRLFPLPLDFPAFNWISTNLGNLLRSSLMGVIPQKVAWSGASTTGWAIYSTGLDLIVPTGVALATHFGELTLAYQLATPTVTQHPDSTTHTVNITNTTLNKTTTFTDLKRNEVVYFNAQNEDIISTLIPRYGNYNNVSLKLDVGENDITISNNAIVRLKYRYKYL